MNSREIARAEYLHAEFSKIAARIEAGEGVVKSFRALARRSSRHLLRRRLSEGSIRNLYYVWRKSPSPETLVRKYGQGAAVRFPAALLLEFLNRLTQPEIVSAHVAFQSIKADWKRGIPLPGIGSWRQTSGTKRSTPPPLPFSRSTFYEHLTRYSPQSLQRLSSAALSGQRDIRRFEAYIEARRAALMRQTQHEPIAERKPQPHFPRPGE